MTFLSIVDPDLLARCVVGGRAPPCRASCRPRGILDAEVGVAAGRPDDAAVDDLGQEAEAVRPVRAPAVHHQAEVVRLHEVRLAGVELEVVAGRVGLDRQLDADPGQRLLQRLGGRLLLRAARRGRRCWW